ncbi:metal ABC transporter ATP-binding protein [Alkalilimnicola ehrlichii]|uniref:ATP-binding cassette domain-containing protein n=1 Tax=Alkalilimnicola ehrlichii TaxID=351052 RepID=UPI00216243B8|nr:metal ABC transporter ATP-binding protein [Alkalilimnicola ehrlichii]
MKKRATPAPDGLLLHGRQLTLRRGQRVLLRDVDVDLAEREVLTLVGPNGAGKSTLLRTLIGLEGYHQGLLLTRPGLRVGYVPQQFAVDRNLPLTVDRLLSLAGGRDSFARRQAVEDAGVGHLLRQAVQDLSGGELRRVLLARALSRKPHVLALDEPAAGLDHNSQTSLYSLIQHLRDRYGFGVLVISHDLHLVMAASDQVVCLGHGRVCCRGEPASVQEHPEYRALFGELGPATAVFPHAHSHAPVLTPVKPRSNVHNG